jgi:hypothetical protein
MSTDDTIKNIITATIQTKVIEALNDTPEAVGKLIAAAINKPVDSVTGRGDGYMSRAVPYIDWLIGQELRDAARLIVAEVIKNQQREMLTEMIKARLSSDKIAESFVDSLMGSTGREWDIRVTFERKD